MKLFSVVLVAIFLSIVLSSSTGNLTQASWWNFSSPHKQTPVEKQRLEERRQMQQKLNRSDERLKELQQRLYEKQQSIEQNPRYRK